ncbi:MAG: ribulose-phosphate 3-epimerase [Deltaproteobacteria bacterium]|jgi:ribulose-phosphate 3-epimerase|nr:ribulose-phosphate 3-epimerase [Deltaproteobacteria bacterium]
MIIVAPSLLSADHGHLAREIESLEAAGADWLHIDVIDGHFAPNLTFGPWIVEMARKLTRLPIDAHLMVTDPLTYGPTFARAGADYVSIHVEATVHLHRALAAIRLAGAKPGVALNPLTPLCYLEECLEYVDLVVVMGVNPGFSGQTFVPNAIRRVETAASLIANRPNANSNVPAPLIEVDGGVSESVAPFLIQAGATVLVSGAYLFRSPDYKEALARLRR